MRTRERYSEILNQLDDRYAIALIDLLVKMPRDDKRSITQLVEDLEDLRVKGRVEQLANGRWALPRPEGSVGRPRGTAWTDKTKALNVRVTEEEIDLWRAHADDEDMSLSEWTRFTLNAECGAA